MLEEKAEYDTWMKIILLLPIAIIVILFPMTSQEERTIPILFMALALIITVYWLLLPRKFRILDDSIEIVLGITYRIPLDEIKEVKKGGGKNLLFLRGLKFATSKNLIVIVRKNGFSISISPKNVDFFIEQLKVSLKAFGKAREFNKKFY